MKDLSKIECKHELVGKIYETVNVSEPSDGLLEFFLEISDVGETTLSATRKYLRDNYSNNIMPHTSDVYCVTMK